MTQYKSKRDHWDIRYIGIWFILTNGFLILFDWIEGNINFHELGLVITGLFAIGTILIFPFFLLLIDGPLNKKIIDYFYQNPVLYIIIGSMGYIGSAGYLIYYTFTLLPKN